MVSPLSRVIGLLQVDSTVGDLAGNAKRLESLARTAKNNGAKLAIATELAICGYPPRGPYCSQILSRLHLSLLNL